MVSGLIKHLEQIEPRHATETEILAIHDKEYHDRIKRESAATGGDCGDGMSPVSILYCFTLHRTETVYSSGKVGTKSEPWLLAAPLSWSKP